LQKTVLAIDIGSTKICAIIAKTEGGSTAVLGADIAKASGFKKGSITNIDEASKSIKQAVDGAKRIAGMDVTRAIVSISAAYTKNMESSAIVNIPNKEIGIKEINRVMQTSLYNANIPAEYEILHALPYNFKVDEQDFIEDPLGMNASRLEVETYIITSQKSNLNNIRKSVKAAGIELDNLILSGYASSISTLNEDEKSLGCAVIDMGGSTSNLVIHSGNAIRYSDFLGVGSKHVTNDLSMALHTPLNTAERVKTDYGTLRGASNDRIEIPVIGDEGATQEVSLEVVYNVIYARTEETLMILANALERSGLKDHLGAGVILTGGFTKLEGIRELAMAIFDNMPVRLARPQRLDGLFDQLNDPAFSTAIGLVKYSMGEFTPYEIDINKNLRHKKEPNAARHEVKLDDLDTNKQEQNITEDSSSDDILAEGFGTVPKARPTEAQTSPLSKFWRWATQLF
jgi:cell division protein FtsA